MKLEATGCGTLRACRRLELDATRNVVEQVLFQVTVALRTLGFVVASCMLHAVRSALRLVRCMVARRVLHVARCKILIGSCERRRGLCRDCQHLPQPAGPGEAVLLRTECLRSAPTVDRPLDGILHGTDRLRPHLVHCIA